MPTTLPDRRRRDTHRLSLDRFQTTKSHGDPNGHSSSTLVDRVKNGPIPGRTWLGEGRGEDSRIIMGGSQCSFLFLYLLAVLDTRTLLWTTFAITSFAPSFLSFVEVTGGYGGSQTYPPTLLRYITYSIYTFYLVHWLSNMHSNPVIVTNVYDV